MMVASQTTAVVPDVGSPRALGTTVTRSGAILGIEGGTLLGANLFHSFSRFSLGVGDTARWSGPAGNAASIRNVINRVTGGEASHIAGTIDSTGLPDASFFFLNPAGVVFAQGAQVNVPGAAYFSTASSLRFSDGVRFVATPSNASTLTIAAPQSFGFVGSEGAIAVRGVGETFALPVATLSLIGASVDVTGSRFALQGLDLVAVSGGAVAITGSQIVVSPSGSDAGSLRIVGGEVTIEASTLASGDLTIDAVDYLELVGAELSVATNDARAAAILLRGAEVRILDTLVRSTTFGGGDAGSVSVLGDDLIIRDSELATEARGGFAGAVGSIRLAATGNVELDNAFVTSSASGAAQGGAVTIEGKDVRLHGAFVQSETDGEGRAGSVSIKADRLLMQFGGISSNTYGGGSAGVVSLVARGIVLANSASVTSDTFGAGNAGGVTVVAGEVVVADNASITSETSIGTGNAGSVSIVSDSLTITNGFVSSDTEGRGNAGAVNIRTGTLLVTNPDGAGAYISSDTLGDGDAGDVIIQATSVTISDQGVISSTSFESGDAGSVVITADTLLLDGGTISTAADLGSRGGSGDLELQADTFTVVNGGRISTASFSPRAAGRIQVGAGSLSIDGSGSFISSENFSGGPAAGSRSGPVGDAGSVAITAADLTVSNGGRITTNSFGAAAGDIFITMPSLGLLILEGQGAVGSIQTSSGAGTGGRIVIAGPRAIVSNGGSILALGQQSGANVTIQTGNFIRSADRRNTVAVDGQIRLEAGLYDVSSGTVDPDISVLDASRVLQGQCPAARAAGVVSQLITRPVGPHAGELYAAPPRFPVGAERPGSGTCN